MPSSTGAPTSCDDDLVMAATLYTKRSPIFRLDVFPFAAAYVVLFPALLGFCDDAASLGSDSSWGIVDGTMPGVSAWTWKELALYAFPIPLLLHFSLFLVSNGWPGVRCALGHTRVDVAAEADTVLVKAARNSGKDAAVAVCHGDTDGTVTVFGHEYAASKRWFEFQKKLYDFVDAPGGGDVYSKRLYPTKGTIKAILAYSGHDNQSAKTARAIWGGNEFDIPLPDFMDLYREHLVAPFFLFQVLCLCLWSLDEYWHYSAMTLIMLMTFEGMLCKQRQNSLQMLREMRRPPIPIYRLARAATCGLSKPAVKGKGASGEYAWEVVSSENLLPGDIVSVTATIATRQAGSVAGAELGQVQVTMPCDAVIIGGSCVVNEAMLTGESTPLIKESLCHAQMEMSGGEGCVREDSINLDSGGDMSSRRYQLYGGTTLLQHSSPHKATEAQYLSTVAYPPPPNKGCVAVIVRTGFGTTQGELMRKILYASERVNTNATETFYFIGLLVIFALVASAVVLYEGIYDESRNKFKLVLHCIMIVTSVVPPELPMELSLAVTHSLAALSKAHVYCTEPFRIPFAGRLNTLCFDKTGTLTQDKMLFRGLIAVPAEVEMPLFVIDDEEPREGRSQASLDNPPSSDMAIQADMSQVPAVPLVIMGVCHALFRDPRSGNIIGDPLEIATFEASGYVMDSSGMQYSSQRQPPNDSVGLRLSSARVLHRYPFSSALKRMSVLVEVVVEGGKGGMSRKRVLVVTKGAPEVMHDMINSIPDTYREVYLHHMSRGKRVLALGYKMVSDDAAASAKTMPRENTECDLNFAGFIAFDSELKADTKSVMKLLRQIDARLVIITGDSAYTAADVGRRLRLLTRSTTKKTLGTETSDQPLATLLMLMVVKNKGSNDEEKLAWRVASDGDANMMLKGDTVFDPFDASVSRLNELAKTNTLCVTGPALNAMRRLQSDKYLEALRVLCPSVTIFARVSPSQKESVLLALNETGQFTLMCGDGTNDVGALRAAHVGVSVINNPELEDKVESHVISRTVEKEPVSATSGLRNRRKQATGGSSQNDRVMRAIAEIQMQDLDPTIVKLGDASIASPFTSRRTSIDAVLTVIRHGRCTLVTTVQIFKILALNCLCSAYLMSALYLRGLKQGDYQMTAGGLVTAGLFFFLSQAKPVATLSPHAPPHSVFAKSVIFSIIGQFLVHLVCLIAVVALCGHFELYGVDMSAPLESLSPYAQHLHERQHHRRISIPDATFQPSLMNSAIFILSFVIQTNNFVVNYRGEPFTQNLVDNKYLLRSVQCIYFLVFVVLTDTFDPLNDLLELERFPCYEFQYCLGLVLFLNLLFCRGVEQLSRKWEEPAKSEGQV